MASVAPRARAARGDSLNARSTRGRIRGYAAVYPDPCALLSVAEQRDEPARPNAEPRGGRACGRRRSRELACCRRMCRSGKTSKRRPSPAIPTALRHDQRRRVQRSGSAARPCCFVVFPDRRYRLVRAPADSAKSSLSSTQCSATLARCRSGPGRILQTDPLPNGAWLPPPGRPPQPTAHRHAAPGVGSSMPAARALCGNPTTTFVSSMRRAFGSYASSLYGHAPRAIADRDATMR